MEGCGYVMVYRGVAMKFVQRGGLCDGAWKVWLWGCSSWRAWLREVVQCTEGCIFKAGTSLNLP